MVFVFSVNSKLCGRLLESRLPGAASIGLNAATANFQPEIAVSRARYFGYLKTACGNLPKAAELTTTLLLLRYGVAMAWAAWRSRGIAGYRLHDSVVAKPGPMKRQRHGLHAHHEFIVFYDFQAYPESVSPHWPHHRNRSKFICTCSTSTC